MCEFHQFLQQLRQPEYVHVLLNPLPVYGLACGIIGIVIGLLLKSRQAQLVGLIIIIFASVSVWPVEEFGEEAYDRVYAMSYEDGQQWLDVHMERAERYVYVFYATALLAVMTIVAQWKWSKAIPPLTIITLVLAIFAAGIGSWVSYAGGKVRHTEFREGPPPQPIEHHQHSH